VSDRDDKAGREGLIKADGEREQTGELHPSPSFSSFSSNLSLEDRETEEEQEELSSTNHPEDSLSCSSLPLFV
jgi:hypothetical protein